MKFASAVFVLVVLASTVGLHLGSCVHDPVFPDGEPNDTIIIPKDTTSKDTNSKPCEPGKIYFNQQVLPILINSCAISGCHDPITKEDGVVLNSFENVIRTGDIKAFDPGGSKLYEIITENDPKKRMPPPPMNELNTDQKKLILDWISQGAKNDSCDRPKTCDTLAVSFSKDVMPVMRDYCTVCHSGSNPQGNLSLNNYNEIKNVSVTGLLVCVIKWNSSCVKMPKGGQKLDACLISKIEAWVHQGAQNN